MINGDSSPPKWGAASRRPRAERRRRSCSWPMKGSLFHRDVEAWLELGLFRQPWVFLIFFVSSHHLLLTAEILGTTGDAGTGTRGQGHCGRARAGIRLQATCAYEGVL